jgi:arsenate reductase
VTARLFFNPDCSKCRTAQSILDEHHIETDVVRYLDEPPTVDQLQQLMVLLAIDDPRQMMRTGEPVYAELELEAAPPTRLLEAMTEHPILLERPIFVVGERAVIARPPERLLELLSTRTGTAEAAKERSA